MLATIIAIIATSLSQDKSSEFSPVMPEEFGEHLIRDQRPFLHPESPDPSDSQLYVGTSSPQFTPLLFCRVQVRALGQPWQKIHFVLSDPFLCLFGLLSWWKIQTWLITRFVTEAVRF